MKVLSLFLSVLVFFIAGYFLMMDFRFSTELNFVIYLSLLVILMLISIVGFLINLPLLLRQRKKINNLFMKNTFSGRN
jgi:hypothetical protein